MSNVLDITNRQRWAVEHGNLFDVLPRYGDNVFDACVCDPPYEIGFMSRAWDRNGTAYNPNTWAAVLRVLKPGAHMLAFGGARTYHRIACAIEDAGFETRDSIHWLYGSGFPKSMNLGEGRGTALKPAHEPIILARKPLTGTIKATLEKHGTGALNIDACRVQHANADDLAAHQAQVEAIKVRGGQMGNSWKNSSDLAGANDVNTGGRWPANLVLTHSADCVRTGTRDVRANPTWDTPNRECESGFTGEEVSKVQHVSDSEPDYRCVDGCPVLLLGEQSSHIHSAGHKRLDPGGGTYEGGTGWGGIGKNQKGFRFGDSGTAARFFTQLNWSESDLEPFLYCAKAARRERDLGCESFAAVSGGEATDRDDGSAGLNNPRAGAGRTGGMRNTHPTVKPLALMRWLCRLITPPGGYILDPFCGSGTTGMAAVLEGYGFTGIELNDTEKEPFVSFARARIAKAASGIG